MKRFATVGFLTSSAAAALFAAASISLYGCVTEEVPPPEIHTSAYVVPEADSAATSDLSTRRSETVTSSSSTSQGNSSSGSSTAQAPAAPMVPAPVSALPPPPVAIP